MHTLINFDQTDHTGTSTSQNQKNWTYDKSDKNQL